MSGSSDPSCESSTNEPFDLVTSSHVFLFSIQMDALSNVMRLLLQSHQHIAGFIVKACRLRQMSFSQ